MEQYLAGGESMAAAAKRAACCCIPRCLRLEQALDHSLALVREQKSKLHSVQKWRQKKPAQLEAVLLSALRSTAAGG
jgi:hypothetical protein